MEKNILIIEQDPSVQKLLVNFLKGASYNTVVARDTGVALEILAENKFGLIILEMEWAKKDKHNFLEKLSQYAPGVPVVVITVFPSETESHPQIRAKMAKPFSVKHLLATVAEHVV